MAVKLNSYVNFNGTARQAIEFYQTVFGGEAFIDTFGKYKDSMPVQAGDEDKVMHGYLKGDNGIELMASDAPTGMPLSNGSQLSLALNGDDEALLRSYWDKLSEGGTITLPLEAAPWGGLFGMVTDKFGIAWMAAIDTTTTDSSGKDQA